MEKTGSSSEIQLVPYDEAYQEGFEDMRRRVPDVSKIEALTGWRPRHTLEDILADTIADVQWELGRCADADQIGSEKRPRSLERISLSDPRRVRSSRPTTAREPPSVESDPRGRRRSDQVSQLVGRLIGSIFPATRLGSAFNEPQGTASMPEASAVSA